MDKKIEEHYWDRINKLSIGERLLRSSGLFESTRQIIEHDIKKKNPRLSEHELKVRVARRTYLNDPQTQLLLDKLTNAS